MVAAFIASMNTVPVNGYQSEYAPFRQTVPGDEALPPGVRSMPLARR